MATHSSTTAWKIPWTEEPGRLQPMGSQRVGHDWATSLSLFFPTQGSNPGLPHCRQTLYRPSYQGSPLLYVASLFSLVSLNSLGVFDLWQFNYNVSQCSPTQVQPIWGPLGLMDLSLSRFVEITAIISLNRPSDPFSFASSLEILIMSKLFFILPYSPKTFYNLFHSLSFCFFD